jgi:2-C-methyl-D-erythritol 4-phosphate cytidylyltransferase
MGVRLGGDVPKQFLQLGGEPILRRTLAIFDSCKIVSEIAVAVPEGYEDEVRTYNLPKVKYLVAGKKTRAESVFAGLKCFESSLCEIVLIHDGIRPFVTHELIEKVARATKKYGAAIAASPVTDTIKIADGGKIAATPNRSALWQAQTPQGFTYRGIYRAYAAAESDGSIAVATDDSSLAEGIGIDVHIVPSEPENIKITTQTDLKIAQMLLYEHSLD